MLLGLLLWGTTAQAEENQNLPFVGGRTSLGALRDEVLFFHLEEPLA